MFERFTEIVETLKTDGKALNVLVAVSGGLDSTVLAHLCKEAKLEFSIAHCNFNLRNDESDEDQKFVEQLAERFGVSLFLQSFDTTKEAERLSKSIQITARELRYDWFENLIHTHNFDYLFAAHHLNDRVETTIFNFLRGGGISGLRSIQQVNGYIARPLLNFTRQDIELYALLNDIKWREDSSNASKKYTRNFIRHEIVPLFSDVHLNWEKAVSNSYTRLEQGEAIIKDLAEELDILLLQGKVDRKEFMSHTRQAVLLEYAIKKYGFRWDQCQYFWNELLNGKDYIEIITENNRLIADKNFVQLIENENALLLDLTLEKPGDEVSNAKLCIASTVIRREDFEIQNSAQNAYFDVDKVKFPIKISSWNKGDTFEPFGMQGKKKLSDFFIDAKIPRHLKYEIPILRDADGEILWIAGYRQSNKYIITSETESVLIFHLI